MQPNQTIATVRCLQRSGQRLGLRLKLALQDTQDELGALRTEVATARDKGATARRAVEDAEAAQQVGAALCDCLMVPVILPIRWQLQQMLSAAGHVSAHSQQARGHAEPAQQVESPVQASMLILRGACARGHCLACFWSVQRLNLKAQQLYACERPCVCHGCPWKGPC